MRTTNINTENALLQNRNKESKLCTVCTVHYKTPHALSLNIKLSTKINDQGHKWIVVDNSNDFCLQNSTDCDVEVLPGTEFPTKGRFRSSIHHSTALNKAVKGVKTRFVIVIDPDLYVVQKNWIKNVLEHMQSNSIGILGVPWHPRWYKRLRGIPCPHFLVIDKNLVDIIDFDFHPSLPNKKYIESWKGNIPLMLRIASFLKPIAPFLLVHQRKRAGTETDTASGLLELIEHQKIKTECLEPVFSRKMLGENYPLWHKIRLRSHFTYCVDSLLPSKWRIGPDKTHYRENGFSEYGFPPFRQQGFEEFFWKQKPFCIHWRGFQKKDNRANIEQMVEQMEKDVLSCINNQQYNNV